MLMELDLSARYTNENGCVSPLYIGGSCTFHVDIEKTSLNVAIFCSLAFKFCA